MEANQQKIEDIRQREESEQDRRGQFEMKLKVSWLLISCARPERHQRRTHRK
jgi:hypothetical protein